MSARDLASAVAAMGALPMPTGNATLEKSTLAAAGAEVTAAIPTERTAVLTPLAELRVTPPEQAANATP